MKIFKKILLGIATVCALASFTPKQAQAADYRNNGPIIFGGVEITGTIRYDEPNSEDTYKLVVPSTGTVTLKTIFNDTSTSYVVQLLDSNGQEKRIDGIENTGKNKITYCLTKGVYTFKIFSSVWNPGGTYRIRFSYNFDSSTNARVSSPAKGKLKVTAPAGDGNVGFQVRYKVYGTNKYITKTVASKKNINKTFKGLRSRKKYVVQVRKYTKDSYGYTYFSNWTKPQFVKIK